MAGRASKMGNREFLNAVVTGLREGKSAAELAKATGYKETTVVQKYAKMRSDIKKWQTRVKVGKKEMTVAEYFATVKKDAPDTLVELFGAKKLDDITLDHLRAKGMVVAEGDISKLPTFGGGKSDDGEDKAASLLGLLESMNAA